MSTSNSTVTPTTTSSEIFGFIPQYIFYTVLAAVVIMIVGYVVGRLVEILIKKIAYTTGLDAFFRKTSIGRALLRSGYTAGDFLGLFVKWVIYIAAIFYALLELSYVSPSLAFLYDTSRSVLSYLPYLVSGVIILVIGLIMVDWISDYFKRSYPTNDQYSQTLLNFVGDAFRFILYYMVITIALSVMKVNVTILYIFAQGLAWAVAIGLGIAIGLVLAVPLREPLRRLLESEWGGQRRSEEKGGGGG
ncbi:MAG: mechanosensitive ion channel family protein [Vulcanisaeta sp.]|jgi:small-conductance mechanosensitive channel|uniref:mechanosensitive ion channel family protein n=1 Tax=Vulcanisaeta sp. TaxID=2020871 RepID=UPI003D0F1419